MATDETGEADDVLVDPMAADLLMLANTIDG